MNYKIIKVSDLKPNQKHAPFITYEGAWMAIGMGEEFVQNLYWQTYVDLNGNHAIVEDLDVVS